MQQQELLASILGEENEASSIKLRLTDLVNEYPWFGAPHYFLLQQMDKNEAGYNNLAAKTALHFSHPYLLQYRLNNFYPDPNTDIPETSNEIETTPVLEFEYDAENIKEAHQPAEDAHQESNQIIYSEELPQTAEETSLQPQEETILQGSGNNNEMKVEERLSTENKKENETNPEEMIFEPLFASDYFASQGIKLSELETPTDKLGKQVKSFTDWLKTMKKLPGSQTSQAMQVDNNVEQLAEKSNTEADVITETMAEVYLQQGRKAKAAEIYHKLSLLNPSKSAFFAAKIEQLKSGEN